MQMVGSTLGFQNSGPQLPQFLQGGFHVHDKKWWPHIISPIKVGPIF